MKMIDLPALSDLLAAHTKGARVLVALAGPPGSGKTYIGRKDDQSPSKQRKGKPYLRRKPGNFERTVVALVERGGSVRSFHVESATVCQRPRYSERQRRFHVGPLHR